MAFRDLIDFSGGLNTTLAPIHIKPNEAVVCTSCVINNGYITAVQNMKDLNEPKAGTSAIYYDVANTTLASTEDRFYVEWGGFLYWSNSAGTIKRYNGTTTLDIGAWTRPTVAPTVAASTAKSQMNGTYTYCYTYMHNSVFESPPSPYTNITISTSVGASITFTDTPPSTATGRTLYRVGGVVPTFHFIADIPIATTTYTDTTSDYTIDPLELLTFDNEPPKSGFDMLIENNGVFWASLGSQVYFSRQGTPEYWYEYNCIDVPSAVKGLGKLGSSIIAFTDSEMFMISGNDLSNMSISKLPFQYGCSNKFSIQSLDGLLIWSSTIAGRVVICSFDGQNVNIISNNHRQIDQLGYIIDSTYNSYPTASYNDMVFTIKNSCVYDRKYYLNTSVGIYIFDFNNGFRISMTATIVDCLFVRNSSLMALKANKIYDFNGSYSGHMNLIYKTGLLLDGSSIANKSYRRVRVKGSGTFTTSVYIDNNLILTSSLLSFYLPAEAIGTTIQFKIESNGFAEISALSYEYEVLAL